MGRVDGMIQASLVLVFLNSCPLCLGPWLAVLAAEVLGPYVLGIRGAHQGTPMLLAGACRRLLWASVSLFVLVLT